MIHEEAAALFRNDRFSCRESLRVVHRRAGRAPAVRRCACRPVRPGPSLTFDCAEGPNLRIGTHEHNSVTKYQKGNVM